jgi:hypothetical protein
MALIVYILCAVTSCACAAMLLRTYAHNRFRLLLWSGLCFVGFALNNILLILDLNVFPEVDLSIIRSLPTLAGLLLLLYGLIWESR